MKKRRIIVTVIVVVSALVFVLPLLWTLQTSFRPIFDIYQYPPSVIAGRLTLANYQYILTEMDGFTRYFLNSIIVTFFTVTIVLASSAMGGYAFGARRFRGQNALFMGILFVLAIPYIVYLIPIYIMEDKMSLLNTWLGLILPYVALNLPWGLLIMRGAFSTIPLDIRDAAVIDGCNEFQLWYRVMLPLTRPALAATAIITFVFAWQEFLFVSTLMSRNKWQTLPVGIVWLRDELQTVVYGRVSAMIILSILPIIILFITFRKFFIKGLSEGMLKG
jgi:ABC-type glycerol-3-phosphate transport system permease component